MPTKSALYGARRADVTGFGVPENHGEALPRLDQSGKLSLTKSVTGWMSSKLGNKSDYPYDDSDVQEIARALTREIDQLKARMTSSGGRKQWISSSKVVLA